MKLGVLAASAAMALAACGGGSGGGGGAVRLAGGQGTGVAEGEGVGGAGGSFGVSSAAGADVAVGPAGRVPAPRPRRDAPPSLGTNPRTVVASTTLTPAGGAITGDDGATQATGLRVAAGATLTLEPGTDSDVLPGNDTVDLSFGDGVLVEGTLRLGRANGGRSAARWVGTLGGALAIRPGGRLVATGDDGTATEDGGRGGALDLVATTGCVVEGTVDTRGGRGMNGGAGGNINLVVASGAVVVSGLATSDGGEGLDGVGGIAGGTEIWGSWSYQGTCDLHLTGSMLARGGAGTLGGGRGRWVYASSCAHGEASASGVVDTSGGDATVSGPGGSADELEIESSDDRLLVTARLTARGGRGAGPGIGGDGGWIGVGSHRDISQAEVADVSVLVAAAVDASGGAGATGGRSGDFEVWDSENPGGRAGVTVAGVAAVDLAGGAGTATGGKGGVAEIRSLRGADPVSTYRIGAVSLAARVDARGGAASAGAGGEGGTVHLYSHQGLPAERAYPSSTRRLQVGAPIDVGGGAGAVNGGRGGAVFLTEHLVLEGAATIEASGGAAGAGTGGGGGDVMLACDGSVRAGAITADGGGSGGLAGGGGGTVTLSAGAGEPVRAGTLSVRGGAGATAGAEGIVRVNGATPPLTGGQLRP